MPMRRPSLPRPSPTRPSRTRPSLPGPSPSLPRPGFPILANLLAVALAAGSALLASTPTLLLGTCAVLCPQASAAQAPADRQTQETQETQEQADQPHPYGGVNFRVRGVFVTPVAGAPFTAQTLIESKRLLPDGTTENQRTSNVIARDNRGRIHNEFRSLMPETSTAMPPLVETHIFDPETRLNTFFFAGARVARQTVLARPQINPALPTAGNRPWVKEEDLGTQTLNGLSAHGLRRSITIAATASGTGKPVVMVDEYWYSEDLHLNLLVHHTDPRTGEQTVAVSNIRREEPSPALFEIPQGFKIVDETPPQAAGRE